MRKLFSLFLALVATTSLWAHDFEVDGIYYNYLDGNNVEVTYRGDNYHSYLNEYAGEVVIPSTVTYNGTTYGVKSIGDEAFWCCSSLTSITIPNSVMSIGSCAFRDCSSLTSVTIPNSVTSIGGQTFEGCSSLTSITIPNSVTSIGIYAFADCSSLTSVTIPNSVTSIGDAAFANCSSLTSITIPNSVTRIGNNAFWCCSSFTSITIPNSVTSIGILAFSWCSSLTSVTIGNSVESIGYCAFYGCSSLTTPVYNAHCFAYMPTSFKGAYVIPEGIKQIAGGAFADCSSLTSVTIPNSVTSIGDGAFEGCSSLVSMVVESGNTKYDSRDNCNAIIETATNILIAGCQNTIIPNSVTSIGDEAFRGCSSLATITIPNSVTSIGTSAFYSCVSLTSVTIPNSVTSIGHRAFENCSSLTSITIPNSVTSIGIYAFYSCESLTSVTIPNSVTSIEYNAFRDCFSLDTITCLAMTPPALGENAFYGCDNPTLFVPCAALSNYQLHEQWGQFTTIECIASEEAETEEVVVESGTTTVIITWPTEEGADTYTIVIKKDGEVVCTLTFNSEGQLLNIAFAPGRNGNHPAQYAEAVANGGYRFTVTGLEEGTHYTYDITVKDASNQTINSHTGAFTTQSTTAVDNITTTTANIQKIMRNGQLIILRDGVEYNAMGQEIQ